MGATIGNRVPADVEIRGLDEAEVGALAYPDFYQPAPLATVAVEKETVGPIGVEPAFEA